MAFNTLKYFTMGMGFKKIFISYGIRIKRLFNHMAAQKCFIIAIIRRFFAPMPDRGIFTFQNILTISYN